MWPQGSEGHWGEKRAVPGQRAALELKLDSEAPGWIWGSPTQPLEASCFVKPSSNRGPSLPCLNKLTGQNGGNTL